MTLGLTAWAKQYQYRLGRVFIDGWRVVDKYGDCDDFALTYAFIVSDRSWRKLIWNIITFKIVFWLAYSPVNRVFPRHTVLYVESFGFVDSSYPTGLRAKASPHKLVVPWFPPFVLIFILMGLIYKEITEPR